MWHLVVTTTGLAQPSLEGFLEEVVPLGQVHPVVQGQPACCVISASLPLLWSLVFPPGITEPGL